MTSSDEEGEILPDFVSDYEFFNQDDQHVSFAWLPILRCKAGTVDSSSLRVFLSGSCSDGLQKFYKQVIAWRYDLSYVQPEILVLCKSNHWTRLAKPKKPYEVYIRSILITVHCLHFVKHNPESPSESLWDYLSKVFSAYAIAPSEVDCANHISLLRDAVNNDTKFSEFQGC